MRSIRYDRYRNASPVKVALSNYDADADKAVSSDELVSAAQDAALARSSRWHDEESSQNHR